ncbi:hypothetical protein JW905_10965, partial [bacterium]|nr:hypothetical protein [candidate division CSSED10-310 bacterium]
LKDLSKILCSYGRLWRDGDGRYCGTKDPLPVDIMVTAPIYLNQNNDDGGQPRTDDGRDSRVHSPEFPPMPVFPDELAWRQDRLDEMARHNHVWAWGLSLFLNILFDTHMCWIVLSIATSVWLALEYFMKAIFIFIRNLIRRLEW